MLIIGEAGYGVYGNCTIFTTFLETQICSKMKSLFLKIYPGMFPRDFDLGGVLGGGLSFVHY